MKLFTPIRVGLYVLPNRVVMAPMTRSRAGPGKIPVELTATYYAQRASAGLLVSEATHISPQGANSVTSAGIYTDEQVKGWQHVTRTVHTAGGCIFLQLWHVGRQAHAAAQPDGALPVAPSAIAARVEKRRPDGTFAPLPVPRAFETAEIPGIVEQYRHAARCALAAGFDGVEIHGANGFLIDQFLRDGSNRRTDRYGGSVVNRVRFMREVVEAVATVWGGDRVGIRLSPTKSFNDMQDGDPARTFGQAVTALNAFDLAYLHMTEDPPESPAFIPALREVVPSLRRAFLGPVILNGGYTRERAEAAIASGEADLVSFATDFISNPDLPERLRRAAPLNRVDAATIYGGGARGYTDYPRLEQADAVATSSHEG